MRNTLRATVSGLACVALMWAGAGSVAAAEIEADVVESADIGELIEIEVVVHDDAGEPLPTVLVELSVQATIMGESGIVVVDTALTDEDGIATLDYLERAPADTTQVLGITAFTADGPVVFEAEIAVLPGPQLHESDSHVDLPVFNVAWLFVVLGIVWAILLYAEWRMLKLGRAAEHARPLAKLAPYVMVGFVIFTAAGMALVLLNRPQSHANFEPGEAFDRAPGAVVGEQHDYAGLGLDQIDGPQSELDGESLYELANCSGCHGIRGEGAVVAGALEGLILTERDAFIDEVRRGPDSMPGYPKSQIDDEALVEMIKYLEGQE